MNQDIPKPPRNPDTHKQHAKQKFWQILVPIMLASIVIIGVAVLVVLSATGGNPGFKPWSDLSVMWILIPIILVSLAGIVVLGYLNFGIAKAIAFIPSVALKTQTFFYTMAVTIRKYADKSVTPFFAWHESGAALKSLFK